jgi:hypothetical protein
MIRPSAISSCIALVTRVEVPKTAKSDRRNTVFFFEIPKDRAIRVFVLIMATPDNFYAT